MPVETASRRQTQFHMTPLSLPPTSPLSDRWSAPGLVPHRRLCKGATRDCLFCDPASRSGPSPHSPSYILRRVSVVHAEPRAQPDQMDIPKPAHTLQSKMRTPDD